MAELFVVSGRGSGTKAQVAAAFAKVPLTVTPLAAGAAPPKPSGADAVALPVLVRPDGGCVSGGNACAVAVAGSALYDGAARGEIDGWLAFSVTALEAAFAPWLAALAGEAPYNGKAVKQQKDALFAVLEGLEAALAEKQFLVGSALTLADVAIVCDLAPMFARVLDGRARTKFPNVTAYFSARAAEEPFVGVLGAPVLCKKEEGAPKPAGAPAGGASKPSNGGDKKGGEKQPKPAKGGGGGGDQKQTKLGVSVARTEDFGMWYSQVVREAELIEYYDISGCYVLRPWAYSIWEQIKDFFDAEIKKLGVENCYFPLFVSQTRLEAEKDHVEGFAPEVAWVTRSGQSELDVPIAVRPTSETVMYPTFANWIRSHRDLPLKLNQWCNVVRWEFKHPTPFIRSREFLWQEGHTAFATKAEADVEVRQILELYRRIYEELLCVPVVPGVKSEKEKFAGGLYTTTVEAFVPWTGRGIQGATSHCLGQNFAKMFGIDYETENNTHSRVWQNSWGCTTRTIGVAIMVHGDDTGLVLPPRIAPLQAVIVPIPNSKASAEVQQKMLEKGAELAAALKAAGVRVKLDDRMNYTPGWKYNHWELKGVPVRIEIGMRDLESGSVVLVRRDNREKTTAPMDGIVASCQEVFARMQKEMLARATEERNKCVATITKWEEMTPALNAGKMVLAPWCEDPESEEWAKKKSNEESETGGACKTLCIPFTQPPLPQGQKCFITGRPATCWALFGRSY